MLGTYKTHNLDRNEKTKTLVRGNSRMASAHYGASGGQPNSDFAYGGFGVDGVW